MWLLHKNPELRHDLDPRFNAWLPNIIFAHYEWLALMGYRKETVDQWVDPLASILTNNWFLHCMGEAQCVIPLIAEIQERQRAYAAV